MRYVCRSGTRAAASASAIAVAWSQRDRWSAAVRSVSASSTRITRRARQSADTSIRADTNAPSRNHEPRHPGIVRPVGVVGLGSGPTLCDRVRVRVERRHQERPRRQRRMRQIAARVPPARRRTLHHAVCGHASDEPALFVPQRRVIRERIGPRRHERGLHDRVRFQLGGRRCVQRPRSSPVAPRSFAVAWLRLAVDLVPVHQLDRRRHHAGELRPHARLRRPCRRGSATLIAPRAELLRLAAARSPPPACRTGRRPAAPPTHTSPSSSLIPITPLPTPGEDVHLVEREVDHVPAARTPASRPSRRRPAAPSPPCRPRRA